LSLLWSYIPWAKQAENFTLDLRYQNFNRETAASDQVVVVDIDDQSLKFLGGAYGRWPWRRRAYKELLEFIAMASPKGIFFDILFTESQLDSNDDQIFSETIAQLGNVSHAILFLNNSSIELGEGRNLVRLPA